jgi:nitrous oxide reductase
MEINRKQLLRSILIILFLFILLFQFVKTKEFSNKKQLLETGLIKQKLINSDLKKKYLQTVNTQIKAVETKSDFKKSTADILTELKTFNLKLIDFSSAQTELNLNLNGSFHSILNFIYFLEVEMNQFKIAEFKIKNNDNDLFFFLKLKNELITNE